MNSQNVISVIINYQNQSFTYNTYPLKSINTFYQEICSNLKILPNFNNLYYGKKILSKKNFDEVSLNEIVDQNNPQCFQIIPKLLKTPHKGHASSKSINVNSISNKKVPIYRNNNCETESHYDTITTSSHNDTSISVIISEIPSVQEIQKILEDFYARKTPGDYNTEQRGLLSRLSKDSVRVDFQTETTLNDFISYISYIKYQNPYFKRIIITKNHNFTNNLRSVGSYSNKSIKRFNNLSNSVDNVKILKSSKNVKLNYNMNEVINAKKESSKNLNFYHGLSLGQEGEDKILHNYYQQQEYLRNSSPYINENEKEILEQKENKKKFLNHKNFFTSVGKYSMKPNYIPNYVGLTPSENPKNHEFRNVNKSKWLNKKGFI